METVEDLSKMATETLAMARGMVEEFARLKGEDVEFRSLNEMTTGEMLAETQGIVSAASAFIGPALQHPMLKPMMRMIGRS